MVSICRDAWHYLGFIHTCGVVCEEQVKGVGKLVLLQSSGLLQPLFMQFLFPVVTWEVEVPWPPIEMWLLVLWQIFDKDFSNFYLFTHRYMNFEFENKMSYVLCLMSYVNTDLVFKFFIWVVVYCYIYCFVPTMSNFTLTISQSVSVDTW